MLDQILPDYVAFEQVRGQQPIMPLHARERFALGMVTDDRLDEFTRGRHCAKRALKQLGIYIDILLIGETRAPLWPEGIVGSITHTAGYCGAGVVRSDRVLTMGIDVEAIANGPITDELLGVITTDAERQMLERLPEAHTPWRQVLFSAKESLFKAWQPIMQRWLGFHDTDMRIDPENQSFSVRIPTCNPEEMQYRNMPQVIAGRYVKDDEFVGTTVVVPASS